jgi:crotonobetainyl-CoA:carnitine CoA-transferase CaiB-like acyl-CoA transferase
MLTPMMDVKVFNLGTRWAGRVASMLLADQGAEVIEIIRPGTAAHACDSLLGRGKQLIEADLTDLAVREDVVSLAGSADIVIENMRPGAADRLGVGHAQLARLNAQMVYVSLPGFAAGDPRRDEAAWEGSINAATGVYTDLSPLGQLLDGEPVFSAIPMASAYGGILGAVTASLGLYHRLATGKGQYFEVPLADAVISAMALLIAKVEGQPSRYFFPPIEAGMQEVAFPILKEISDHLSEAHVGRLLDYVRSFASPMQSIYEAADGRLVFVNANDHMYQTRALLSTLGVFDKLIAEGMVAASPYEEGGAGNNLFKAAKLSLAWRRRVRETVAAVMRRHPAAEWERRLRDANVPVTVVQTTAEWLANPQLYEAGVTCDLDDPVDGLVRQAGRFVTISGERVASPSLHPRRSIPVPNRFSSAKLAAPTPTHDQASILAGVKVLDFSNIIAGPAAGRTLAEFGAEVIRVDPPAPQAGPFATMWFGIDVNQGKRAIIIDLKTDDGRDALQKVLADVDVVLHNFLDPSALEMGIDHATLSAANPDIISCQISAWGGGDGGPLKNDPAFDPVLQAASGIMSRYGTPERPVLHGIASCVDYMTGFSAAFGIVQALTARALGRGGSHVHTSLATAAQLVQFPFMAAGANGAEEAPVPSGQGARGAAPNQSLYRFADGWGFLGYDAASDGTARASLSVTGTDRSAFAERLATLTRAEARTALASVPSASVRRVSTLAEIRAQRTVERGSEPGNWLNSGSIRLVRGDHPSGFPTTLPTPTWIRPARSPVDELAPAPFPGTHTVEVLREAGLDAKQVEHLLASGVAREQWPLLDRYLPD